MTLTFIVSVEPTTPGFLPLAVTTISPFDKVPFSSNQLVSFVACSLSSGRINVFVPCTIASCCDILALLVVTIIGLMGLRLAISRAVAPDAVSATIAFAFN